MYYGIYKGIVSNITDPEGRMRIKARVPSVLGEGETEWAEPCVPPGWGTGANFLNNHAFTDKNDGTASTGDVPRSLAHTLKYLVPQVKWGVWIMFEDGDREKPVWLGVWRKT